MFCEMSLNLHFLPFNEVAGRFKNYIGDFHLWLIFYFSLIALF